MMGLIVKIFVFILSGSYFACGEVSKEAVVIQVRKKLQLHPKERIYRDYYVRGGKALGLVPGTQVEVVRRLAVHDPFANSSVGDFYVKIADVEVIHSDHGKSIVRLMGVDRQVQRPMLHYDAIMVGDRLNLSTLRP